MNGHKVVWDHVTRPVRDDDREAFKGMKPGDRYGDIPAHLRRYRDDIFDDKYNKLDWNSLSRSITAHIAKDGYWYIHPSEHRTLSVREAARVQTFPDCFRFAGPRSAAFRQIGNAVPPALAETIGKALLKAAKADALPPSKRRGRWLATIREAMTTWGRNDALEQPWRYPGDPWAVLCGIAMGGRSPAETKAFLAEFPKPGIRVAARIERHAQSLPAPLAKTYRRLARWSSIIKPIGKTIAPEKWADLIHFTGVERKLFEVIALGDDQVIATAATVRCAARVTGTNVDANNMHSDGRMVLGQLLGDFAEGPMMTAAFYSLGRTVCTVQAPDCARCPVRTPCIRPGRPSRAKGLG